MKITLSSTSNRRSFQKFINSKSIYYDVHTVDTIIFNMTEKFFGH